MTATIENQINLKQRLFKQHVLFYFLSTLVLTTFYIIAHRFFSGLGIGNIELLILGVGSISFACGGIYLMTLLGYYRQMVYVYHWGSLISLLISLQIIELGVFNPTYYLSFSLIVSSGYFLGLKSLVYMTILSALGLCWVFVAEHVGLKQSIFPPARLDITISILSSLIILAFTSYTLLRELQKRTNLLQIYKDDLEIQVKDRTAALGDALTKAEEANTAKSVFLATMSHELRTPLNAIIGYTEMVEEELNDRRFDLEVIDDVAHIKNSGRHLLDLINSILDLSKIEAGEEEVTIEAVVVKEMIDEVIAFSRPLFDRSENMVFVEFAAAEKTEILTDRRKLYQILLNLISNANKFTQSGSIFVTFELDSLGSSACLTVRDTGIGIPADKIERLFEPFQQLDNTYDRKYEGTGLGLAISKRFSEMLGGDISAENHPDEGAVFTLVLPIKTHALRSKS